MECPVCYESKSLCTFTCGHSFCHECTKSWYNKGNASCPMCRGSLCFKGFLKLKQKWHQEKQEQVYIDLVTQAISELEKEYLDVLVACLEVIQNRFNYTMCRYPNISCDELYFVLRMTWVDVDSMMNEINVIVHEPQIYRRYLFVNKTEYGVKNLSHAQHVIKCHV